MNVQAGLDPMHTVDLGIWVHLITAIAYKYDEILNCMGLLSPARIANAWKRLSSRCQDISSADSMLSINEYKASYMKILLDQKKAAGSALHKETYRKLEAWEHHILMLVSNYMFCLCPVSVSTGILYSV